MRGGPGTAARTLGLLGGMLTYAVDLGLIDRNPVHGIKRPKDNVRDRRLTEAEYRTLGEILREAAETPKYGMTVEIIRQIALTGCRRSEMIGLKWTEADTDASCMRLEDSKEGASIRPIGLAVVEYLEKRRKTATGSYVFPGQGEDNAFGGFPNHWRQRGPSRANTSIRSTPPSSWPPTLSPATFRGCSMGSSSSRPPTL